MRRRGCTSLLCPLFSSLKRWEPDFFFFFFFFNCATYASLNQRSYVNLSMRFQTQKPTNFQLISLKKTVQSTYIFSKWKGMFYVVFLWDNTLFHEIAYACIIYLSWFHHAHYSPRTSTRYGANPRIYSFCKKQDFSGLLHI